MEEVDEAVGYRKPPRKDQFRKGQSGNPNGRPRKVKEKSDAASILTRLCNEEMTVGGRQMTQIEIVLRRVMDKAMRGDLPAARELVRMYKDLGLQTPRASGGGVLVVPGILDERTWEERAYRDQAKFRGDDPEGLAALHKRAGNVAEEP